MFHGWIHEGVRSIQHGVDIRVNLYLCQTLQREVYLYPKFLFDILEYRRNPRIRYTLITLSQEVITGLGLPGWWWGCCTLLNFATSHIVLLIILIIIRILLSTLQSILRRFSVFSIQWIFPLRSDLSLDLILCE